MPKWILEPVVQYGFVGFSAALLAVVVWLINRLLQVLDANNKIISSNTAAIRDLTQLTRDLLQINRTMHDKLLTRPCIATREEPRQ